MGENILEERLLLIANVNSDCKKPLWWFFFSEEMKYLVRSGKIIISFFLCNMIKKKAIVRIREVSSLFPIVYMCLHT